MYQDPNMLASIRKVEAAREENIKLDPRRMTADEKDALLKKFHPDYRTEQFTELRFGPNKGQKVPLELADAARGRIARPARAALTSRSPIMRRTFSSSAAAAQAARQPSRPTRPVQRSWSSRSSAWATPTP